MAKNDVNVDGSKPDDEKDERNNPTPVPVKANNLNNTENIKIIKTTNKVIQALNLPTVMNVNPRSIYNKVEEFHNFVDEEEIDCVFMSESWEHPDMPLDEIINLPNHVVISNTFQRKGIGGRPALIINNSKFHVKNLSD